MANETFKPYFWDLGTLFEPIYEVPVYQRPYSWDKEQVDMLLSDIFDAYRSGDKTEEYFTGNIIIYDTGKKVGGRILRYKIIDGQQRITTFALILLALYTKLSSLNVSDSDSTFMDIKKALWCQVERKYREDCPTVALNSIDETCFSDLYKHCFEKPKTILSFCKNYQCKSPCDKRIISNFQNIYKTIQQEVSQDDNSDEILNFADYILTNIKFIVIESSIEENKAFSIFESINSKGKDLDDIDLIKTYIFSKLDEASYSTYLAQWGQLIIKTQDKLKDYLYIYIRAFIKFYTKSITVKTFKILCQKNLLQYFNVTTETEALKKLLDDMCDKVDCYNMLSSVDDAYKLVNDSKFRFYYTIFIKLSYEQPKALLFRTLVEYKNNNIDKDTVADIVYSTVNYMMKLITISKRENKQAIKVFTEIMNNIYKQNRVSKDFIIYSFSLSLDLQGITADSLKASLRTIDCYSNSPQLTMALLSLYVSTSKDDSGKISVSYDQAYNLLSSFGSVFNLDHLLVQTPEKDSIEFKYYKDDNNTLVLKPGHDFPEDITNGMDYEIFKQKILNQIGNLRISYRDKNSMRQNAPIELPEYEGFNTYNQIVQRGEELANSIIDYCLPLQKIDVSVIEAENKGRGKSLPRMGDLIDLGIINKGDQIYIIQHPEDSVATLIDGKYVNFNGEKMTINEWATKVTGWSAADIYHYTAIVGEDETLQQKRMNYVNNIENEDEENEDDDEDEEE